MYAYIAAHRHEQPMHEYLITMDPPAHAEQRSLVMRLLTPRRMREHEGFMGELAERQLAPAIESGRTEVFTQFAQPFAMLVVADMLGVPEADRREFTRHLTPLLKEAEGEGGGGSGVPFREEASERAAADPLAFIAERFAQYVRDRRAHPGTDVLSEMAGTTYGDGTVPEVEAVVRMAVFLFAAGQDTTARLVTTALRILAEDQGLQDRLRASPEMVPGFAEEVLRHQGVVKHAGRLVRRTTTVAGVEIPRGSTVALFPQAANRDPAHYDAPDELRLDRPNPGDHLAFGRGIHACAGASLARVETRVALERILAMTSSITIDEEHHGPPGNRSFDHDPVFVLHGLQHLHLRLRPAGS
jgi:cytochrome P450